MKEIYLDEFDVSDSYGPECAYTKWTRITMVE